MSKRERIDHYDGDPDVWICLCGNMGGRQGFRPCDDDGNEVEPVHGWKFLFVCDVCGRIIDGRTRDVVGMRRQT